MVLFKDSKTPLVSKGTSLMVQPGLFDLDNRLESLSRLGDPLLTLNKTIPWNTFRPTLTKALKKFRKNNAGRKPFDSILMFKILILQSLYNLSDDQTEYQIKDRLSFTRFLDLQLEETIPDAKTLWTFRDTLSQKGAIVKQGEVPTAWKDKPDKLRQKDTDARWTKKNGKSYFGYKNHINTDRKHKLIRNYEVSDASVHDSKMFDSVLDPDNTGKQVWADSAYRSSASDEELKRRNLKNEIHYKGYRNRPLSKAKLRVNKKSSKVRARVEHVFGFQQNSLGGKLVRSIGILRAKAKIGMMNLAYNIKRYAYLQRLNEA
jgi:IS5 family transposase